MTVTRLTYYSQNHIDPAAGSVVRELSSILSASNRNNKPLDITGALVFDNQWFLQIWKAIALGFGTRSNASKRMSGTVTSPWPK